MKQNQTELQLKRKEIGFENESSESVGRSSGSSNIICRILSYLDNTFQYIFPFTYSSATIEDNNERQINNRETTEGIVENITREKMLKEKIDIRIKDFKEQAMDVEDEDFEKLFQKLKTELIALTCECEDVENISEISCESEKAIYVDEENISSCNFDLVESDTGNELKMFLDLKILLENTPSQGISVHHLKDILNDLRSNFEKQCCQCSLKDKVEDAYNEETCNFSIEPGNRYEILPTVNSMDKFFSMTNVRLSKGKKKPNIISTKPYSIPLDIVSDKVLKLKLTTLYNDILNKLKSYSISCKCKSNDDCNVSAFQVKLKNFYNEIFAELDEVDCKNRQRIACYQSTMANKTKTKPSIFQKRIASDYPMIEAKTKTPVIKSKISSVESLKKIKTKPPNIESRISSIETFDSNKGKAARYQPKTSSMDAFLSNFSLHYDSTEKQNKHPPYSHEKCRKPKGHYCNADEINQTCSGGSCNKMKNMAKDEQDKISVVEKQYEKIKLRIKLQDDRNLR